MKRGLAVMIMMVVACKGGSEQPPKPGDKPPAPAGGGELAALQAQWLKDAEANIAMTCARPVLRGEAAADDGAAAIATLFGPDGTLKDCRPILTDKGFIDSTAVKPQDSWQSAGVVRTYGVARALDDAASQSEAVLTLEKACAPAVATSVGQLAQRAAPCSPWLNGRTPPGEMIGVIQVAKLVVIEARARARKGDVAGAAHLLLDGARFSQDMGRGPAALIAAMVSGAARDVQLTELERLLSAAPALPAAELDALAAEVEVLWASEPAFVDAITGELQFAALIGMLPNLYAADGVPPGGWPEGIKGGGVMPKPQVEALWKRTIKDFGVQLAACPRGQTARGCYDALKALDAKVDPATPQDQIPYGFSQGLYRYAAKFARSRYRLAALRWHLATLRAGGCDPDKLAKDFAAPAELGDPMTALKVSDGVWDLTGPAWLEKDAKEGQRVGVWRMHCGK